MYLPSNDLPTYFNADPPYLNIHTCISKYLPFLVRNNIDNQYKTWILDALKSIDSQVDISCCGNNEFFSGNPIFREKVDVKACDFLNAWMDVKRGLHHWLLDVDLKLYLSQCCFWSADDKTPCDVAPGLIEIPTPEILQNIRAITYQANIWMNIHSATSTLHYDTSNNLLVMLDGKKDVILLSPDCTNHLHPVPASDENPNHSILSPDEVDSLADKLINQADMNQKDALVYRVTLLAGDVLYIPEGWWHQVRSDSCSMALNYWFNQIEEQPLSQCESVSARMSVYELRKGVCSLVQKEREAARGVGNEGSSALYHAMSFTAFEAWLLQYLDNVSTSTKSAETCAEQCNDWLDFATCSFQEMRRLWVPFAEKVRYCSHLNLEIIIIET